jgi:hypothetical protein
MHRVERDARHYEPKLEARTEGMTLKMPKLRRIPFEAPTIQRYLPDFL